MSSSSYISVHMLCRCIYSTVQTPETVATVNHSLQISRDLEIKSTRVSSIVPWQCRQPAVCGKPRNPFALVVDAPQGVAGDGHERWRIDAVPPPLMNIHCVSPPAYCRRHRVFTQYIQKLTRTIVIRHNWLASDWLPIFGKAHVSGLHLVAGRPWL